MAIHTSTPRTIEQNGQRYVSVTSAMKLVKQLLGEEPDYFGPLADIHAAEGSACHAICLNWLAMEYKLIPSFEVPVKPDIHPDNARWLCVLQNALLGFQEFCKQHDVVPIGIEQESFSKIYGLVGHLDLYCELTIRTVRKTRVKAVVDLKFVASILESHRLQVRCYGRLDGFRDAQVGLLYHHNRTTGIWKLEPVNLTEGLDDVMAVSHAAKLWAWKHRQH